MHWTSKVRVPIFEQGLASLKSDKEAKTCNFPEPRRDKAFVLFVVLLLECGPAASTQGFQAKCLRQIMAIPSSFISRVSNKEVLRRAQYPEATALLMQSQLQILGKVMRAPATSQLHSCAFSPGTLQPATSRYVRRVGRPRKEWIPGVMAEAARRSSPQDLQTIANDSRQWKMAMSSR